MRKISLLTDMDGLRLWLEHRVKGDYQDDKNTEGIKIRLLNDSPNGPTSFSAPGTAVSSHQWLCFPFERFLGAGTTTNKAHLTNEQALGEHNCSQMSSNSKDPCSEGSHLYGRKGRRKNNPRPQCSHVFGTGS